jgi:hypothetical protein
MVVHAEVVVQVCTVGVGHDTEVAAVEVGVVLAL